MKYFAVTRLAVVTGVGAMCAWSSLAAQQTPSPAQAAQLLQRAAQQPGGADQVRARLRESGLSPEQIRARLRASGYPADLLDAYLPDARLGQEGTPPAGSTVIAAMQALGLPVVSAQRDTLPVDTGLVRVPRRPLADTVSAVFGVDVFRRTTTQFLPTLAGPVPADYRLGPGDQLVLILTGDVELAHQLTITREGFVLIPEVGQVFVANLTLQQLRSTLYDRLGRVYSSVRRGADARTRFDVTVANVRAVQVYVIGEVSQPGAYQVSSLGTVLTALYAAGGVTERGNMRRMTLRRGGRDVATFDLYDYLLRGDTRSDIRLETGDVIYVPVHGTRVEVKGAVVRPAIYEMGATETLAELIAAAGGLRADAAAQRIQVERIVPPARRLPGAAPRVVVDVPLQPGTPSSADAVIAVPQFPLADGDIVTVDSLSLGQRNYVEIEGNVYLPGRYAYEPGMRLSRLVQLAGGFQPATYAGRAHIERLNAADSTRRLLASALPPDTAAPWPEDPALTDRDIVTIFGRPDMRSTITVAIAGMVNQPGQYPWREGMTLRDLMLRARGPRIGADLREAEVSRLPADRTEGQLATTMRVPLDSTYLFDRDSLGRYIGPPGVPFSASGAPEFPLQPYDNVLVLRQPDFELQRTVIVQGQVRFPGAYDLRRKDERLAELIERAGGLTAEAYPQGIRFFRDSTGAPLLRRELEADSNAPRAPRATERVNIDLPRALRDRDARDNLILQPGDSILIPEYQPIVRVTGAVNAPGLVLWRQGAGLSYYIAAAGGFARSADRGGTSVRQPDGEVEKAGRVLLLFRTEPEPGPGAEVSVPARLAEDKTDVVALFGAIAQILASTVAIVVVATR